MTPESGQSPGKAPEFELQPHLMGELLELRPLGPKDWEGLFSAAADPLIWEQHPQPDRYKKEVFQEFFQGALDSGGAFTVVNLKTGQIIGSTRFDNFYPSESEIEVGWTFLARSYWGGEFNGEMKRLMLNHAFRFVDNVAFVIGPENWRSRRAVEKIGATLTDRPGRSNTVVYRISKLQP